jgi:hypothetical protein
MKTLEAEARLSCHPEEHSDKGSPQIDAPRFLAPGSE